MFVSSPARLSARSRFIAVACVFSFAVGCTSSGSGSGCTTLQPFAKGEHYVGPKNDNAVNVRLSAAGVNYLNTSWRTLLGAFLPGNTLTVPVSCIKQVFPLNIAGVSTSTDVYIADQGHGSDQSDGRLDRKCDLSTASSRYDAPLNVTATVTGFALAPQGPDKVGATVTLAVNTGKLFASFDIPGPCNGYCSFAFDNTRRTNPTPYGNGNPFGAIMQFTIDTKWDKLLSFRVTTLTGSQVCGSSGASDPPNCVDSSDISLNGEGINLCSYVCDLLDVGFVKEFVLGLISPMLQDQINAILSTQACAQCETTADCPASTDGSNTQSTCDNKVCVDPSTHKCVPRFLGLEGRLKLGALLGKFGVPSDAEMDMSLAAGSNVKVDTGMTFGTRVGLKPVKTAACVPPVAAPSVTEVPAPDFDAEATAGSGYHVGLGVSSGFLNEAFWAAHQSGALCLSLSSDNVGLLSTGLFKTFLRSLGDLTTRDGKDAPMMVVLRPAKPPSAKVGLGTYDPVTKKPVKPLVTVLWPDLTIDFYAFIDDREVRVFSLTADIALPLSLIFEGCDKMTPALGDVKMLISNVRTSNSEMLAENPQVLADLLPAVVGLAEPAIGKALEGFALPSLGTFKLKVNETKGLGVIPGTDAYNHLGIYAQLLGVNDSCAVSSPRTSVSVKRVTQLTSAQAKLDGNHALPIPTVELEVHALGKAGTPQFAYKVDDGLWNQYVPVIDDTLTISHPRLLMQGRHTIDIRSRVAEDPHGVSAIETVAVQLDWEPPEVSLSVDRLHNRVLVHARDVISRETALTYAYQVGAQPAGEFGAAREVSLSAIEAQGGVTVFVKDEFGNVGKATYAPRAAAIVDHPDTIAGESLAPRAAGCTVAGLEWSGLALMLVAFRRRSSR